MIAGPSMTRVSKRFLPSVSTLCPQTKCVYNTDGTCDDPQCNKGNSDADCHTITNRELLGMLTKIEGK